MLFKTLPFLLLLSSVIGQQAGDLVAEIHPVLTWQKCTRSGGCVTQASGKIVLDSNWRWAHSVQGYTNCYTEDSWNPAICSDPQICAKNCALEGVDYKNTFGISTSGNSVTLKLSTTSYGTGSRIYLLSDDRTYQRFKLKNQEIAFDVDVSNLPCGLSGALYFTGMDADGGMAKYSGNRAGARFGTGYCDAQCPRNLKFINGEANLDVDSSGTGQYGSCCTDIDVWESNTAAAAYIAQPCTTTGQTRCSGSDCSSGFCDAAGCDFNSYRMGNKTFYGPGRTVDTNQTITVITRFITSDGTSAGQLSEIRRLYVQNGQVIQNSKANIPGMAPYDSITEEFCTAQKAAFGDENVFAAKGGFTSLSRALESGMVLAMSVRDDPVGNMRWLDSIYPLKADPSKPGVARGPCPRLGGQPQDIPGGYRVTFSNIRFGDVGSTVAGI